MPVRRGHVAPRTTLIETIIRKFDTDSKYTISIDFIFGVVVDVVDCKCDAVGSAYTYTRNGTMMNEMSRVSWNFRWHFYRLRNVYVVFAHDWIQIDVRRLMNANDNREKKRAHILSDDISHLTKSIWSMVTWWLTE